VRRRGLAPLYVSPGSGKYFYACSSLIWIGSVPLWLRRNATPHQTHELTIALFISTSVMFDTIANAQTPNPNKILTFASILTLTSKPFKEEHVLFTSPNLTNFLFIPHILYFKKIPSTISPDYRSWAVAIRVRIGMDTSSHLDPPSSS
jgi:hypothetical protein